MIASLELLLFLETTADLTLNQRKCKHPIYQLIAFRHLATLNLFEALNALDCSIVLLVSSAIVALYAMLL